MRGSESHFPAWNGIMQPHERLAGRGTDLEVGEVDKPNKKKKCEAQCIVGLVGKQYMQKVQRREELSPLVRRMQREAIVRY